MKVALRSSPRRVVVGELCEVVFVVPPAVLSRETPVIAEVWTNAPTGLTP